MRRRVRKLRVNSDLLFLGCGPHQRTQGGLGPQRQHCSHYAAGGPPGTRVNLIPSSHSPLSYHHPKALTRRQWLSFMSRSYLTSLPLRVLRFPPPLAGPLIRTSCAWCRARGLPLRRPRTSDQVGHRKVDSCSGIPAPTRNLALLPLEFPWCSPGVPNRCWVGCGRWSKDGGWWVVLSRDGGEHGGGV